MVLVEEVVHFVIHSFHYMVSNKVFCVWYFLDLAILNVLSKVPKKDSHNVFSMILRDDLKDIH